MAHTLLMFVKRGYGGSILDPLHTVLQSYPAIIYWLDEHLRIQGCNQTFMQHFDMRSADEAYGTCLRSLHSAEHPHAESWYQNNLQALTVQQPASHAVLRVGEIIGVIRSEGHWSGEYYPLTCTE